MSDNENPAIPTEGKCFILRVSTGCTCCSNENFIEGTWLTREAADKQAEYHRSHRTLSSQYAENGHQSVIEIDYELAGKWLILDGQYAVELDLEECEGAFHWPKQLDQFKEDHRL